jgi:site-specific recombinase XerD
MTKEEYINQYRKILRIRNLLPNSRKTYMDLILVFLNWCERQDIFPPDITKEQLLDFFCTIKSNSTFRQMRGTVYNFYEYVIERPYILSGIPFAKRNKTLPEYLTIHEIDRVFKSVKNNKQRIILKLMYNCGLRVHEVVKIKWKDFICLGGSIYDLRVIGKGNKPDLIPVSEELINEIIIYLGNRFGTDEYIFKGQFKEFYSTRSVQIVFNKALLNCGIHKNGSTHLCRHSIATHLAQGGMNAMQIKVFMRHNSIKTSDIYVHLVKEDLRKPLDVMRQKIKLCLSNQKELNGIQVAIL